MCSVLQSEYDTCSISLADYQRQLCLLKEQYNRQLLEADATAREQAARLHEEKLHDTAELKQQHSRYTLNVIHVVYGACLLVACASGLQSNTGSDVSCRHMDELTRRHTEQLDNLNARLAELDAENRKLRDQKYQLDTQVQLSYAVIHVGISHLLDMPARAICHSIMWY